MGTFCGVHSPCRLGTSGLDRLWAPSQSEFVPDRGLGASAPLRDLGGAARGVVWSSLCIFVYLFIYIFIYVFIVLFTVCFFLFEWRGCGLLPPPPNTRPSAKTCCSYDSEPGDGHNQHMEMYMRQPFWRVVPFTRSAEISGRSVGIFLNQAPGLIREKQQRGGGLGRLFGSFEGFAVSVWGGSAKRCKAPLEEAFCTFSGGRAANQAW